MHGAGRRGTEVGQVLPQFVSLVTEKVLPPDPTQAQCVPTDDDILGPYYQPGTPRTNTICTQDPE